MGVSFSALELRFDECLPAKDATCLPVSVGGLDRLRGPHAASEGWLIDLIVSLTLATKDL